jgi:hypothetical protein
MAFDLPPGKTAKNIQINLNGKRLKNSYRMEENRVIALLEKSVIIEAEQKMEIIIQC